MGQLAERVGQFAPSGTLKMTALARQLAAEGREIIALSSGEPDFPTPDNIKEAGIRAIRENVTKYTATDGTPDLKRAISRKLAADNGLDYPPEQIVVANGTKPLLLAAMMALADPGDEVIVPAPYWVSYPEVARIVGASPVFVPCPASSGFRLQPDALEAAITERTRVLVITSPHNPTGAVYRREDMEALVPVLRRHPRLWVLTDEIYEHIFYNGGKPVSFAAVDRDLAERVVVTNGFSKGYVMTGWRLGFAAGPRPAIQAMSKILGNIAGPPNAISQAAAVEALLGEQPYLEHNVAVFRERRDLAVEALNQMPGITCAPPDGAFYLFAGCAGVLGRRAPDGAVIASDTDFVHCAAMHAGVVMVPGSAFGLSPYFRITYALATDRLRTALERLRRFCNALS
jgi:aspartate aminotransferase